MRDPSLCLIIAGRGGQGTHPLTTLSSYNPYTAKRDDYFNLAVVISVAVEGCHITPILCYYRYASYSPENECMCGMCIECP